MHQEYQEAANHSALLPVFIYCEATSGNTAQSRIDSFLVEKGTGGENAQNYGQKRPISAQISKPAFTRVGGLSDT